MQLTSDVFANSTGVRAHTCEATAWLPPPGGAYPAALVRRTHGERTPPARTVVTHRRSLRSISTLRRTLPGVQAWNRVERRHGGWAALAYWPRWESAICAGVREICISPSSGNPLCECPQILDHYTSGFFNIDHSSLDSTFYPKSVSKKTGGAASFKIAIARSSFLSGRFKKGISLRGKYSRE
jgi:hypothetical protein